MNQLNDFLQRHLEEARPIIGGFKVDWKGQLLDGIYNEENRQDILIMGGLNSHDTSTILIPQLEFTGDARPKKGDHVVIDKRTWEVDNVTTGKVTITLILKDPNKRANAS